MAESSGVPWAFRLGAVSLATCYSKNKIWTVPNLEEWK